MAGLVGGLVQTRNSHPPVPTGSAGRALDFQMTRSPLVGLPLPNPSQRPAVRVAFSNRPKCTSYQLKCTKRMSKLAGGVVQARIGCYGTLRLPKAELKCNSNGCATPKGSRYPLEWLTSWGVWGRTRHRATTWVPLWSGPLVALVGLGPRRSCA